MQAQRKISFKFEEAPFKKGKCPKCLKSNCFRYYLGLPRQYGICDHKNKCEHINDPNKADPETNKELYKLISNDIEIHHEKVIEKKILYPANEQLTVFKQLKFCFPYVHARKNRR